MPNSITSGQGWFGPMLSPVKWVKKKASWFGVSDLAIEQAQNSHNCSENYTKTNHVPFAGGQWQFPLFYFFHLVGPSVVAYIVSKAFQKQLFSVICSRYPNNPRILRFSWDYWRQSEAFFCCQVSPVSILISNLIDHNTSYSLQYCGAWLWTLLLTQCKRSGKC